jgi:holo-[acyl-carrier protein] synthase
VIVGLGSDVVEIDRIASACRRHGEAFLRRVLSDEEHEAALLHMQEARQHEFVAGRFAVKEAMAKASGLGLGRLQMSSVTVKTTKTGLVVEFAPYQNAFTDRALNWFVSISHSDKVAFAVAILERV